MKKITFVLISVLSALIASAFFVGMVSAGPAAPLPQTLTQPDSSTLTAYAWGDEWSNGYETLDGYTLTQDSLGWWVYATRLKDGSLAPALISGRSVSAEASAPEYLLPHLRPTSTRPDLGPRTDAEIQYVNFGTQPVLVLLASFNDRSGTYSAANFASSIFGSTNSVKHFYQTASYGSLTLTPAVESQGTANDGVIGWLNLGYNHPNTGSSTSSTNSTITKNALIAANSYIDYSSYDTNGDGYISSWELHIIVVVAGYERSYSNNSPSVWAHQWCLNSVTVPQLDGVYLGDWYSYGGYSQVGEIHYDHPATIGVIAHEMGHDLSWPDLYDTVSTNGGSDGVGEWSIMGSGNWNRTGTNFFGSSPALPDAWLKWYQGWITPTAVSGTLTGASIPEAETNASAFLLGSNPNGVDWEFYCYSGSGEYFLVENRQLTSYDAGLRGNGLLIWHIDESVAYDNSANGDETHPLVKLVQADGLDELLNDADAERGDNGDPYPGVTNKRTFNYTSTPNSRLYNGTDSLVSVLNISNCATTMTADLTYGTSNQAPIANAGADFMAPTQTLVNLDGSLSTDPDGNTPLTYLWAHVGGPSVTINNPNTVNPSFTTPSDPGIVTLSLVVTDSLGMSSSPDHINITFLNQAPVANAGTDRTTVAHSPISLDGSASSDPDGDTPLTYQWTQTGGTPIVINNANTPAPNFLAPPIPGPVVISLVVTDSLLLPSAPDFVTINVINQAPVANAGPDQVVTPLALVFLNGSLSSDPDGHLPLTFQWTQTGGTLVTLSNANIPSPCFTPPAISGDLTFSLVVTDFYSMPSTADQVKITVLGFQNFLPLMLK